MDAIVWYRSPVFVGLIVSFISQVLAIVGVDSIAPDAVAKLVDLGLQLLALGSAAYAVYKRKTSALQPLTVTTKGAVNHPQTIANASPPPAPPPDVQSHWVVAIFIMLLLAVASQAHADTLVRTQSKGWQLPPNADIVQVLRTGGSVWVPLSTVLATERVMGCVNDPAVAIGSSTTCTTRPPGQTDNWLLKSTLTAAPVPRMGIVTFAWNPVVDNTDGTPANLAGYTVIIRRQNCEVGAVAGCNPAPTDPPIDLGNVLTYTVQNVAGTAGFFVQARSVEGYRGVITQEVTGSASFPASVPSQATGVRVVPPPPAQ